MSAQSSDQKLIDEWVPVNEVEQKLMNLLREKGGEPAKKISDSTVLRFVRGFAKEQQREQKTVEMFQKMLAWREENKVDELVKQTLPKAELFHRLWPGAAHGVDRLGHPIYIERPGQVPVDELWKQFTFDELKNFHVQAMENLVDLKEKESKPGKPIYKHFAILDLQGMGMAHCSKRFINPIQQILHIDQYCYPETLYTMVITNPPFIFKAFWAIASPFIDPITKTRILWGKDNLKKFVDEDQIPQFLGGKCKCKDGKCLEVPFEDGRPKEQKVPAQPVPVPQPQQTSEQQPVTPPGGAPTSSAAVPGSAPAPGVPAAVTSTETAAPASQPATASTPATAAETAPIDLASLSLTEKQEPPASA